jgi:hypothetical protein
MKYPAIASDCHLLSPVVQAVKVPSRPSKLRIVGYGLSQQIGSTWTYYPSNHINKCGKTMKIHGFSKKMTYTWWVLHIYLSSERAYLRLCSGYTTQTYQAGSRPGHGVTEFQGVQPRGERKWWGWAAGALKDERTWDMHPIHIYVCIYRYNIILIYIMDTVYTYIYCILCVWLHEYMYYACICTYCMYTHIYICIHIIHEHIHIKII